MRSQVSPDTNEQPDNSSGRLRKENIMDTYIRIDHRGSANKRSTSVLGGIQSPIRSLGVGRREYLLKT